MLESYDAEDDEEIRIAKMKQKMADDIMNRINNKIENEMSIKKANRLRASEYIKSFNR
jgi:hypothetical protein